MARYLSGIGVCVLWVACAPAGDEPSPVNKQPTATWSGELADPAIEKARPNTGVVTNQADFEKLWKAWRGTEKAPVVDFKTSFVAIKTWLPNKTTKFVKGTKGISIFRMMVSSNGNAELLFGPALPVSKSGEAPAKWVETKGFYYGLAVFSRAGVKKVDGKELPAP